MNRRVVPAMVGSALIAGVLLAALAARAPDPAAPTPEPAPDDALAAQTAPALTLNPDSGVAGQQVVIAGAGWQPYMKVALSFRPNSAVIAMPVELGAVTADEQGRFRLTQTIPQRTAPGGWKLTATGNDRFVQIATAPFLILPPVAASRGEIAPAHAARPDASPPAQVAINVSLPAPVMSATWNAEYYANPDLIGTPLVTRTEDAISYTWDLLAPDPLIPLQQFSARWSRSAPFAAGGYRVTVACDDGVRIFVDSALVIDTWIRGCVSTRNGYVYLSAGQHDVQVQYVQRGGPAFIRFDMQPLQRYFFTSFVSTTPVPPSVGGAPAAPANQKARVAPKPVKPKPHPVPPGRPGLPPQPPRPVPNPPKPPDPPKPPKEVRPPKEVKPPKEDKPHKEVKPPKEHKP